MYIWTEQNAHVPPYPLNRTKQISRLMWTFKRQYKSVRCEMENGDTQFSVMFLPRSSYLTRWHSFRRDWLDSRLQYLRYCLPVGWYSYRVLSTTSAMQKEKRTSVRLYSLVYRITEALSHRVPSVYYIILL